MANNIILFIFVFLAYRVSINDVIIHDLLKRVFFNDFFKFMTHDYTILSLGKILLRIKQINNYMYQLALYIKIYNYDN